MKRLATTRFFAALIGFAAVNLALSLAPRPSHAALFSCQPRDLAWWTVKRYRELDQKPDLVLIGSSVMTKVTNEGDATYLGTTLDARTHHRSRHLEDLLSADRQLPVRSASLSVPGMNASDVALTANALLAPPNAPGLLVYGIAPRDLMDNAVPMPSQTPVFHLLSRTGAVSDTAQTRARLGPDAIANFFMNKTLSSVLPLYRYQDELTLAFRRTLKARINELLPQAEGEKFVASQICSALHIVPEEADLPIASLPYSKINEERADLRYCYVASFNPFREKLYRSQRDFLKQFLSTCKQRGTRVMLVNMPLRSDVYGLMPPDFYRGYLKDVSSLSAACDAEFVDLHGQTCFNDEDFVDQVHLNGDGGCKFARELARAITERHTLFPSGRMKLADLREPTIPQ